jgi:ABC-2 type transport system permease protein
MSTATVPAQLDLTSAPRISLATLVRVELRKLVDTRASRWLIVGILALTALILVIFALNATESDRTFRTFIQLTGTPQGFLLPVLGILLVTSEWSQRAALTTFTLMPVRGRVLLAKVLAALIAGVIAYAIAVGFAAICTVVAGGPGAWQGIGLDDYGKYGLTQVAGVMQGLAFGLLFLNTAGAIVTFFVLPTVFSIVASLWKPLGDAAPWVDLNTAQGPLLNGDHMSGKEWWQLAAALAIWVVLPFIVGLVRVLRAEVK